MEFFLLLNFLLILLNLNMKKEPSSSRVWKKLAEDDMEFLKHSLIIAFIESQPNMTDKCRDLTLGDPDSYKAAPEVDISTVKTFWGLSTEDLEMFRNLASQKQMPDVDISKEPAQVHEALLQCYKWVLGRSRDPEKYLIGAYVDDRHPLHIRRTLDQSYYYMLDNTRSRNRDQVVSRYGEKLDREPVVMMVDQLWLWILEGNEWFTMPNAA
jgi:hypothetical protein